MNRLAWAALVLALAGCGGGGGGGSAQIAAPANTSTQAAATPDYAAGSEAFRLALAGAEVTAADDFDALARAIRTDLAGLGLLCGSVHFDQTAAAAQRVAEDITDVAANAGFDLARTVAVDAAAWGGLHSQWGASLAARLDAEYTAAMAGCVNAGTQSTFDARRADIVATVAAEIAAAASLLRSAGHLSP